MRKKSMRKRGNSVTKPSNVDMVQTELQSVYSVDYFDEDEEMIHSLESQSETHEDRARNY